MANVSITKNKKAVGSKSASGRKASLKKPSTLTANALGIAKEYLVSPKKAIARSATQVTLGPSPNLSVVTHGNPPLSAKVRMMHRPLLPPRTSFWTGVGFGVVFTGGLMAVAWYLMRVELIEAVMVALTRP